MSGPDRLLIFHPGALGDVVVSFFAIGRLARCFSSVHLLCQGQIGKIARRLKVADRTFPLESALFSGLYGPIPPDLAKWLSGYENILLFSISASLGRRLQAEFPGGVFRVRPRPAPERRVHVADHIAAELGRCGLLGDESRRLGAPPQAGEFPDRRGDGVVSKRILLHPGAGSRKKRWPASCFLGLAGRLKAAGFAPRFLLGPAETDLERVVYWEGRPPAVTVDAESLLAELQAAEALVGNDSGVSHLAAFMGLPTVAVFGPSDPVQWAPRGRAAAVVRRPMPGGALPFDSPEQEEKKIPCRETGALDEAAAALSALLR